MNMMLPRRGYYALRALLILARRTDGTPMRTPDIAAAAGDLSVKFLEAILLDLRKGGLLHSVRGRSGGYLLARPVQEITFADILRITDGSLAAIPCVRTDQNSRCAGCLDDAYCLARPALNAARAAMLKALSAYNLGSAIGPGQFAPL